MLSALLGDGTDLDELKRLIIERTGTNPFFMEEIVQSLFEDGVVQRNGVVKLLKSIDALKVPATVQGVLGARIDRLLPDDKELLQTLAVLGREFPLDLVKDITLKPDDELGRGLSRLQAAEFIYEQSNYPDIEYTFKHALTLEVGYNSMLIERRRLLHELAAQAIEALFYDRLEDHLSELAHHYDRSGNVRKAIEYLGRAGRAAALQTAHPEAVNHLNRALVLLRSLPDNTDRGRQEFDLQMALSWSLFVVNQVGPEREPVLVRALELSEQLGENARHIEALLQLAHFRLVRREYHMARELAERVIGLAEPATAPAMLVGAHFLLGAIAFYFGRLLAAREHHENAIALLGPEPFHNFGETQYAQLASGALPLTLLFLGYPASALEKGGEFLTAMRRLSDPAALAGALMREVVNRVFLHDSRTALERAEELTAIAAEHGMRFHTAIAGFARGWALANSGRGEEGLAQMSKALPPLESFGATPLLYAVLAETYCKNGRAEEGLETVATAFRDTERGGERIADTELHRVKGELLLIRDPAEHAAVKVCFRTAIDVACDHAAKLYELRATTSLARLLTSQDRRDEARTMLADVYNWFTEGFDTVDLKDAKALLDRLNSEL
jgi:tetratricopeptide (TPR) repeat protein